MQLSLAFHIVGLVLWLGGLMILTRFLTLATSSEGVKVVGHMARRVFIGFVVGGLTLTTLSGLHQFGKNAALYMSQGWFHTKVTLVLVLLVVTYFVGRDVSRINQGATVTRGRVMLWHAISGSVLIAAVFITMLGR